ncbi:hypothetical protein [Catalinimonas alkaloidigena]|uniref:hypothetical protein n=1 Tax=Catalinimonas alkaloidigena TaxID=1075417 RepID=UPI00115F784F|nr:hypothetical protein [Catalinimonas alkaloidigena]
MGIKISLLNGACQRQVAKIEDLLAIGNGNTLRFWRLCNEDTTFKEKTNQIGGRACRKAFAKYGRYGLALPQKFAK